MIIGWLQAIPQAARLAALRQRVTTSGRRVTAGRSGMQGTLPAGSRTQTPSTHRRRQGHANTGMLSTHARTATARAGLVGSQAGCRRRHGISAGLHAVPTGGALAPWAAIGKADSKAACHRWQARRQRQPLAAQSIGWSSHGHAGNLAGLQGLLAGPPRPAPPAG